MFYRRFRQARWPVQAFGRMDNQQLNNPETKQRSIEPQPTRI
jgi:hypothetical protein